MLASWPVACSGLPAAECAYTSGLFAGKSTLAFTHPRAVSSSETVTTTCYCSKFGISWYSARQGLWKNLKFNIIEC